MPLTRAFKSGNSQAVRISADLALADISQGLRITRGGDVVTTVPARLSLGDAVAELRELACPPDMEVREPIEVPERSGL